MTASSPAPARRTLLALVVPATGLAALLAFLAAWGPDWPAADFRAWLARNGGLTVWSNAWYSGDATVSYSVLYPYIAFALGAALTGLVAVGLASLAATGLAPTTSRLQAVGFQVSVTVVLLCCLVIGQVPFLAGVAAGAWAVRALLAGKGAGAFVLAVICSLVSPIAGAFLVVTAPAAGVALGAPKRALPLIGGVLGPVVAVVFGGVGGDFPFATATLIEICVFCAVGLVLARERAVQVFLGCYLAVTIASYVVANPVGGDVARLGELIALPLAWHIATTVRFVPDGRARWAVTGVLVAVSAAWQIYPAASAASRGAGDPSQDRSYYAGVLHFLRAQDPRRGRVEVVFTREHWESYWVAREVPLARGWERQTDLHINGVLYHPLTARTYRRWLDDHAVDYVALPDAPIDYGGAAEETLLAHAPAYLTRAYHDAHWTVWKVRHPQPLVTGAARMTSLAVASFELRFRKPGDTVVRLHGSDLWQTTGAKSCVDTTRRGWTRVRASKPGRVTVRARLSWDAVLGRSPTRCSSPARKRAPHGGHSGKPRRKSTRPAK